MSHSTVRTTYISKKLIYVKRPTKSLLNFFFFLTSCCRRHHSEGLREEALQAAPPVPRGEGGRDEEGGGGEGQEGAGGGGQGSSCGGSPTCRRGGRGEQRRQPGWRGGCRCAGAGAGAVNLVSCAAGQEGRSWREAEVQKQAQEVTLIVYYILVLVKHL